MDNEKKLKKLEEENKALKTEVANVTAERDSALKQVGELQKVCESYARQATIAENITKKATLDYNTKVDYMLDCVRHAYTSIRLAKAAAEKENERD
jgi:hypothetical protein